MLARTHMAFGVLVGLIVLPLINRQDWLSFLFATLIGSVILDLDHPKSMLGSKIKPISWIISAVLGHRTIMHSLFFVASITIAVYYFFSGFFAFAICLGCISHITLDCLTVQGVNILYPFATMHVSGFIETGAFTEKVILALVTVSVLIKLVVLIL